MLSHKLSDPWLFHDFIFAFLHTCFMDDLFYFLGSLTFTIVPSKTVAPSSKWQLSSSSSAYLLPSLNTDRKFLFFFFLE